MTATVWKGYVSFGLISFPVRLFTAARADPVHFHMLHKKDLSRVRSVSEGQASESKALAFDFVGEVKPGGGGGVRPRQSDL